MLNTTTSALDEHEKALQIWQPSIQQQLFKSLMQSFSYPGRVITIAQQPALMAVVATLVDQGITLADPAHQLDALFTQRIGCRLCTPSEADFVLCEGLTSPDFIPSLGSLECPEAGATVIVSVDSLNKGTPYRLRGPGIQDTFTLQVTGLDNAWIKAHQKWRTHYPMGADLILVTEHSWVALPRTLIIMEETR